MKNLDFGSVVLLLFIVAGFVLIYAPRPEETKEKIRVELLQARFTCVKALPSELLAQVKEKPELLNVYCGKLPE